jgi:hypothetical protein
MKNQYESFEGLLKKADNHKENLQYKKDLFYKETSDFPGSMGDTLIRYFQSKFTEFCLNSLENEFINFKTSFIYSSYNYSYREMYFYDMLSQLESFKVYYDIFTDTKNIIESLNFDKFLKFLSNTFDSIAGDYAISLPSELNRDRHIKLPLEFSCACNGIMRNEDIMAIYNSSNPVNLYRNPDIYKGVNHFSSFNIPSIPYVAGPSSHAYKFGLFEIRNLQENPLYKFTLRGLLHDLFYFIYLHFGYHSFIEIDCGFRSAFIEKPETFNIEKYQEECSLAVQKTLEKLGNIRNNFGNKIFPVRILINLIHNLLEANVVNDASSLSLKARSLHTFASDLINLRDSEHSYLTTGEAIKYLRSIIGTALVRKFATAPGPFRKRSADAIKVIEYLNSDNVNAKILRAMILEVDNNNNYQNCSLFIREYSHLQKSSDSGNFAELRDIPAVSYKDLLYFTKHKKVSRKNLGQQLHAYSGYLEKPIVTSDIRGRRNSIKNINSINRVFTHDRIHNMGREKHFFITKNTLVYRADTRPPSIIINTGGFKNKHHYSFNPYNLSDEDKMHFFGKYSGDVGISTTLFEHIADKYAEMNIFDQNISAPYCFVYKILLEPANIAIPNAERGIGEVNCARTIYPDQILAVKLCLLKLLPGIEPYVESTCFVNTKIDRGMKNKLLERKLFSVENELFWKGNFYN